MASQGLEVSLYDTYAKASLLERLTPRIQDLQIGTALHGGFKECSFVLKGDLGELWAWLSAGHGEGRHFRHLEVTESQRLIWEGRIAPLTLDVHERTKALTVTAYGYWHALRDEFYYDNAIDAGNTNWTVGGPHTVDDIIKEMLTNVCPSISSDQSNIPDVPGDVVGITFREDSYPQDLICDVLAPLGDSSLNVYHAGVWDNRVLHYVARSVASVDWYVKLQDVDVMLTQTPEELRNSWKAKYGVAGVATYTAASEDADSIARYVRRRGVVDLTAWGNIPVARAQNARDVALAMNKWPRQVESFTVRGPIYERTVDGGIKAAPKWRVRAGDVLRIQDLVPESVTAPALDDIRTFYVLETSYDADADSLIIQPDRQSSRLGTLLARIARMEPQQ